MAEEESKKEDEKLEFTPEGETLGYISLDQARVLALQHARDNREIYGRYADRELVWEVVSADETEDLYEVRLSYRPARAFRGQPGLEHSTIDKTGPIQLRQILTGPQSDQPGHWWLVTGVSVVGAIALTGLLAWLLLARSGEDGPSPPIAPASVTATNVPAPTSALPIAVPNTVPPTTPVPKAEYVGQGFANVTVPEELPQGQSVTVTLVVGIPKEAVASEVKVAVEQLRESRVIRQPASVAGPRMIQHHYEDVPVYTRMSARLVSLAFESSESGWVEQSLVEQSAIWSWSITPKEKSNGPQEVVIEVSANDRTYRTFSNIVVVKPPPTPVPVPTPTPTPLPTTVPTYTVAAVLPTTDVPDTTPVSLEETPQPQYLLETAISPQDQGGVEVRPAGADGLYIMGALVTVTAQCALGFISWAGDNPLSATPTSSSITVTMDRDRLLVAFCVAPPATPMPVSTLPPTPTATPEPRYTLRINGFAVGPGQNTQAVGNGIIALSQPPDSDGAYARNTELTLQAVPDATSQVFWSGVDSESGNLATVQLSGPRNVSVSIVPLKGAQALATPVPTPAPNRTLAPTPTPSPTPMGGKIVFVSYRDGNGEIYVMNADGSGQTNLSNNSANDLGPAWSPDGSKIAFFSYRDGNYEIYVMNADGSGQTNLTNNSGHEHTPAWSPDGTRIAFDSYRTGVDQIYVMDADGSNQMNVSNSPDPDTEPSWSPDGTKIAFTNHRDGPQEIYVMNVDGSNRTRLTTNPAKDFGPAWSASGTKILFTSDRDGHYQVYVMDADGSNQSSLSNNSTVDLYGDWSPEDTQIAFRSQRVGNQDIYVMNADGSNQTRITINPAEDGQPDWGP